jgi:chromate transporter
VFGPLQHQAVEVQHWISSSEFVELFAIARAAPGPGTMLVTLVGWKIAGWTGAVIATLALFVPSSLLCYGVARVWNRYRGHSWHVALERGLAPVGVGLILAGILAIARVAGNGILLWIVAIATALVLTWRSTVHPMLLLGVGAAIFIAAWGLQIG